MVLIRHPIASTGSTGSQQLVTLEDLHQFKQDILTSIFRMVQEQIRAGPKRWIKSYELKERLGISSGTLMTLRANGTIPYCKIGNLIYYDWEEVCLALQAHRRGPSSKDKL